jgi:hypothetical protein
MLNNDSQMLEEAYLSISKKTQTPDPTNSEVSTDPNSVVNVGPMDEPAPGIDANMADIDEAPNAFDKDTTGVPVSLNQDTPEMNEVDLEQEDQEDQMSIENLNSIRESIVKIAACCASGGHLEIWAQQKLAIAMDNLAEVARRLR